MVAELLYFTRKVLVTQSCPTLCHSIDYSPPGSSVHEILQAKYWSGQPCLSLRDLPDPGIKPVFPALQADCLPSETPGREYWREFQLIYRTLKTEKKKEKTFCLSTNIWYIDLHQHDFKFYFSFHNFHITCPKICNWKLNRQVWFEGWKGEVRGIM